MYPFIFIQDRHHNLQNVDVKTISIIETQGRYSKVVTIDATFILNDSLTQLEAVLPALLFCRVHRAYIVPLDRIICIGEDLIHLKDMDIPLTKHYREQLLSRVIKLK